MTNVVPAHVGVRLGLRDIHWLIVRKMPEMRSHLKCMGSHFVLCSTKEVEQLRSGTQFNRLIYEHDEYEPEIT